MTEIKRPNIWERIISIIGFHKIDEYHEDIGQKQKKILNEFSTSRDDIEKIYTEITGKELKEKHKIHVLIDIIRYFNEIVPALDKIEMIPALYKAEKDKEEQKKLIDESHKKYNYIKERVIKIRAHLLDLKHPNTNLRGYNAIFDMWRYIEKRLHSNDIKMIIGVSKNIKFFQEQLEILGEDLTDYKSDEKTILNLDEAFLHTLIHLKKEFILLKKDYQKITTNNINHNEIKEFTTRVHYIKFYLDRLKLQEEKLFNKGDKFVNPFEEKHKIIALQAITKMEDDIKRLMHTLTRFINENLDSKKFKTLKI